MNPLVPTPVRASASCNDDDHETVSQIERNSITNNHIDDEEAILPSQSRGNSSHTVSSHLSRIVSNQTWNTARASSITVLTTPKQRWGAVVALLSLATMCLADVFILAYLYALPTSRGPKLSIKRDLSLSQTDYGLLMSYVGVIPRLATIMLAGRVAGNYPTSKKDIIVASGGVIVIGLLIQHFASSSHVLGIGVIILNMGVGLNTPMNPIIVGDLFDRNHRAIPMACIVCSDYLGGGFAAIAGALAVEFGWRSVILFYAVVSLIAVFMVIVFVPHIDTDHNHNIDEGGYFDDLERNLLNDIQHATSPSISDQAQTDDEINRYESNKSIQSFDKVNDEQMFESNSCSETESIRCQERSVKLTSDSLLPQDTHITLPSETESLTTNEVHYHHHHHQQQQPNGELKHNNSFDRNHPQNNHDQNDNSTGRDTASMQHRSNDDTRRSTLSYQHSSSISLLDGSIGPLELEDWGNFDHLAIIFGSPKLILLYLGGGVRIGGGMAINSYNPQFFGTCFGSSTLVSYATHATVSVVICGCFAQIGSGYVTQHYLPGLIMPVLTCLAGGIASIFLYSASEFSVAIGWMYVMWLVGEGWFVGVVTSLQQSLPPGKVRDTGLGLFFASSVLIGAADVFLTSQGNLSNTDDDDTMDDNYSSHDNDGNDDDDGISGNGILSPIWNILFNKHMKGNNIRISMILSVSSTYLLSSLLFGLAMILPDSWCGITTSKNKELKNMLNNGSIDIDTGFIKFGNHRKQ